MGTRRQADDRGAVLVIVAVGAAVLFIAAALVIDLGFVRSTRQTDRSTADFAVEAGLHGLETSVGVPQPWAGVCRAIDYLQANDSSFADLAGTYTDDASTPTTFSTSPCQSTTADPYTRLCSPSDRTTWAVFTGTADGGRTSVEIRSGYVLPDARFSEDSSEYAGDVGDASLGGCDQLAVILSSDNDAIFGGVIGSSGQTTTIRSVGRVTIGDLGKEAVALLLLEQTACRTLYTSGNNTYVWVRATPVGAPTNPGLIHTNSTGTDCSGGQRVIEGSSSCSAVADCTVAGPSIVAENVSATVPGRVGNRATTVNPSFANTQACADPAAPSAGCTIAPIPSDRGVTTRAPVDDRYLARVTSLKATATTQLALSNAAAAAAGYFVVTNCNSIVNQTVSATATGAGVLSTGGASRVFLDCNVDLKSGETTVFDSSISSVVVDGSVSVTGRLELHDPRSFYVDDDVNTNGGTLVVNQTYTDAGGPTCTSRFTAARDRVTALVVATGQLRTNSNAVLRLCNTFVLLAHGTLPTTTGTPPSNNSYNSRVDVGSQSTVDWRAPNQSDAALDVTDPLYDQFEDLALWTEYSGNCTAGNAANIGGQGAVVATGVFFLPNACPFNISGGGSGARIDADAQFIARRLELSGTVALTMAPNPNNVVQTPRFDGFVLVR
jgi:hypothetical protein